MKKRDMALETSDPAPFLKAKLQDLKPHNHLCLIYKSEDEWKRIVIPFIAIGLKKQERCIYIVNAHTATEVHEQLERQGIDTKRAEASGQLAVLNDLQVYAKDTPLDPDLSAVAQAGRLIGFLIRETTKALEEGYTALRITSEMTWLLDRDLCLEKLVEYESKLNRDFFPEYPCLALCQYDRRRFDPEIIKGVILTHPYLIRGSEAYRNLYCIPPERYLRQERDEAKVDILLENIEYVYKIFESLQEREMQYRRLFEESNEGILICDASTGIIIDCNQALLKLLEYENDELIGKPQKMLYPPEDDIGNVSRTFEGHRRDKVGQVIETRIITKRGKLKDVEITARFNKINGRKVLQGTFRDITERKKMEDALRASEENFRNSMDNSPFGIRIATKTGKTIYTNQAMLDIYGYSSLGELNTTPIKKRYTHKSYIEYLERQKRRRQGEPAPSSYEISIMRKDGEIRHLLVFCREVLWNGRRELQRVYQDITEKRLTEESLKAEKERYKTLMEHLPIGIAHIDSKGNYLYINPKFTEIFGYTIEDIPTGREFFHKAFPDPEYRHKVIASWIRDMKKAHFKKYFEREFTVQCKAGTQKVVRFQHVIIGKNETLLGFQDITAQKEAKKALEESERKYHNLFERSLEGIFQTTPEGRYLALNPAKARISGYSSPEEMMAAIADIGKQLYVNPEDRDR